MPIAIWVAGESVDLFCEWQPQVRTRVFFVKVSQAIEGGRSVWANTFVSSGKLAVCRLHERLLKAGARTNEQQLITLRCILPTLPCHVLSLPHLIAVNYWLDAVERWHACADVDWCIACDSSSLYLHDFSYRCHGSCADCVGPEPENCLVCARPLVRVYDRYCMETCPDGKMSTFIRCDS